MSPVINTDAVLWYNIGEFGQLGYGVPNPSDDPGSLNPGIIDLVSLAGRNLFHIMHHEDADLRIPPSINTVRRIHKLYVRLAQILASRAVPPGENNMEAQHLQPGGEIFKVYPVPYFKVRNLFMKRWAELIMMMMSEAMQHTENRKTLEISTGFAGQIGQYMQRVYRSVATELFGKTREEVRVEGFILTEQELSDYDPSVFFTSTEMVDTVPHLGHVFTEDRLSVLSDGIPVTSLPELQPWPTNLTSYYNATKKFRDANVDDSNVDDPTATAAPSAGGGPVIPQPPGP
ncbi:hypothetical protein LCGC14_0643490 [marine sediment metagenome]|uniref:Uncharacterized protein n=1 Tax=marine sediment metagenome TaxID=412755 RepID=A0A0F9U6V7_9ZZZZ